MGDYLMSLIKANDIQNASGGIPTVKSQQLIPTAWVVFNGTGTVAIIDSENVSSITDNAVGQYYINFAVAQANTNYAVICSAANTASNLGNADYTVAKTTANCLARHYEAGTYRDSDNYQAVIFSS